MDPIQARCTAAREADAALADGDLIALMGATQRLADAHKGNDQWETLKRAAASVRFGFEPTKYLYDPDSVDWLTPARKQEIKSNQELATELATWIDTYANPPKVTLTDETAKELDAVCGTTIAQLRVTLVSFGDPAAIRSKFPKNAANFKSWSVIGWAKAYKAAGGRFD